MNNYPRLFLAGFIQLILVTTQVWFISNNIILGACITSFLISFVWCHNVKKIAFGGIKDVLTYSSGASSGCFFSLLLTNIFK